MEIKNNITLKDNVEVTKALNLESLLYELALENFKRAQKSENRLQRIKYSAATIIFAQTTVEAYFNFILETRLTSSPRPIPISPAKKRWVSIIQAIGLIKHQKHIETKDVEKKSDKLIKLRNPIIHYYPKFISLEKLKLTKEGRRITKAEEMISVANAKKALKIAKELILEIHRIEESDPPDWLL